MRCNDWKLTWANYYLLDLNCPVLLGVIDLGNGICAMITPERFQRTMFAVEYGVGNRRRVWLTFT